MKGLKMGLITSVSAITAPQAVARTAHTDVAHDRATIALPELPNLATAPVTASKTTVQVAPEAAVRMSLDLNRYIMLDNIPFVDDDAVLLDDLPRKAPEQTADDPLPVEHVAQRGYLAGREATTAQTTAADITAEPQNASPAVTEAKPIPPP